MRGKPLSLPITADAVPPVVSILQQSNLINQTSLAADADGSPAIATYFRRAGVTNVQAILFDPVADEWRIETVSTRSGDFDLAGPGTRSLPISRPLIVSETRGNARRLHVVYRDAEEGDRAVIASSDRAAGNAWTRRTLPGGPLDRWEPSFDSRLWRARGRLDLYLQRVGQVDREGVDEDYPPTDVRVLEVALP